jgi:hypothetical protein
MKFKFVEIEELLNEKTVDLFFFTSFNSSKLIADLFHQCLCSTQCWCHSPVRPKHSDVNSLRDYIFSRNSEEARHVGVVCTYLHVAQPEVCINISLSDEDDIIEFSVFY